MIALIGRLPATLEDRAIVLPMRRRAPGETVDRVRRAALLRQLDPLRRRTARWVADHLPALRVADPAVPDELDDRQADNWRPLLAIADEAGGAWADLARAAARTLSGTAVEADNSAPVQLLADVRHLFVGIPTAKLATATLIRHLTALEDRPWADLCPRPSAHPAPTGQTLGRVSDRSEADSLGTRTLKGYLRADFTDAFGRYLPGPTQRNTVMTSTL